MKNEKELFAQFDEARALGIFQGKSGLTDQYADLIEKLEQAQSRAGTTPDMSALLHEVINTLPSVLAELHTIKESYRELARHAQGCERLLMMDQSATVRRALALLEQHRD